MLTFPGFVGPSYVSQNLRAADQLCMNWYVERLEVQGEPFGSMLYPTPGCETLVSASESPVRALTEQNGRCFAGIGQTFYELNSSFALVSPAYGTVARDANPASFAGVDLTGSQLFFTSGDKGYIYALGGTSISEVIASGAAQGAFLDGFFLALDSDTSTLKVSALNDGTTWEAAQVAQRTAGSDPWQAVVVVHRDIWLFGKQTTEVWYNAGTSPFPFAAIPGAFLEHGIVAPFSAKAIGNTVMWLGSSDDGAGVVYRANGYNAQRVSTHAVEYAIQGYMRQGLVISDAVAFTYQEDGHVFYVLNFPEANATWVYDLATELWHERGTWDIDKTKFTAWRPQYHAFFNKKHVVGDRTLGTLYEMSIEKFSDAGGGPMRRVRRTPHLNIDNDYVVYDEFQVELQTGLGLTTGQGSDPQAMLRWSDDGGETWGNEHWVSAGKRGEYGTRAIWRRLGRGYDRVYELAVSDPVPWRLIGAYIGARRQR